MNVEMTDQLFQSGAFSWSSKGWQQNDDKRVRTTTRLKGDNFLQMWKLGGSKNCYTLCLKNDTDIAHYNSNAHQPI